MKLVALYGVYCQVFYHRVGAAAALPSGVR
jgi:hypothetical protein